MISNKNGPVYSQMNRLPNDIHLETIHNCNMDNVDFKNDDTQLVHIAVPLNARELVFDITKVRWGEKFMHVVIIWILHYTASMITVYSAILKTNRKTPFPDLTSY